MHLWFFLPCLVIRQFHGYDDEPSVSSKSRAAFYVSPLATLIKRVLRLLHDLDYDFEHFLYDNQPSKAAVAAEIVAFPYIHTTYQTSKERES